MSITDRLAPYVSGMNTAAELYHGEHSDILLALSDLVGRGGAVYGVDKLNPFSQHEEMQGLPENVHLKTDELPPVPHYLTNLDALVIREFLWTYNNSGRTLKSDRKLLSDLQSSLDHGGHLILVLNGTEQKQERGANAFYQQTIAKYMPKLHRVESPSDLLGYQKR